MAYRILVSSFIYGNLIVYYQDRLLATLLSIFVVLLTSSLRGKLNAIKATNQELDRLVAGRNAELDALASKLIAASEQVRVSMGQELHDGIGQHLTGIKLFCTSLADRLLAEQNPNAYLADSLSAQVGTIHNKIRKIARMLFPVRIGQVGLIPALNELASCFQDMEHIEFSIKEQDSLPDLPEKTALQLYRVCQETANYALDHLKATRIGVQVSATPQAYNLEFGHDGLPLQFKEQNNVLRLIEYRLQQISGTAEKGHCLPGMEKTTYTIPHPEMEAPA
jgi:glucose-6-phosphate-specific signal transduction histidine kinase